jgi:hypothetical protein
LIIYTPETHASILPHIKRGLRGNSTALTVILMDENVLAEAGGANDWRLVGSSRLKDGVVGSEIHLR